MKGWAIAGPSLALIKYWGKRSATDNTPATGSLAVTLAGLESRTEAAFDDRDSVTVNGEAQPLALYAPFLGHLKTELSLQDRGLAITSANNFPTAAGLASSSSGFRGADRGRGRFSRPGAAPRPGSRRWPGWGRGSATRSVFGGFTVFEAGAGEAHAEHDENFWPEFRVVLAVVREGAKSTSSRAAMESSRTTSPYYGRWVESSVALLAQARAALGDRDWGRLGPLIRQSYLRMFATMFSADPPLLYWQPESLALIQALESLRRDGFTAFETMDAGPQVKVFCPASQTEALTAELGRRVPGVRFLTAAPGPGLTVGREA